MSKHTLLIELGTEEMPAQYLLNTEKQFTQAITKLLQEHGFNLENSTIKSYSTPRRIAILLENIDKQTKQQNKLRTGPLVTQAFKNDKPTPAAIGFAKSAGINVENLQTVNTPKGDAIAAENVVEAKSVQTILIQHFANILEKLPIPKRMRWGNNEKSFLRPIHWICALLDSDIIPLTAYGITAKDLTFGHRFLAKQAIPLKHAKDYEKKLSDKGFVIASFNKRMQIIKKSLEEKSKELNCCVIANEKLIEEVTGLVDNPNCMVGKFAKHFLEAPKEALVSAITHHQKCFPLQNSKGQILNKFILISNMPAENQAMILKGNERVMVARLADAAFFYNEDKKILLNARLEQLKHVVFQQKLGTLYEKANRVAFIAKQLAKHFKQSEKHAHLAGLLCKADLTTDMVGEFPELQGIMGYYLSLNEGINFEVALAIKESYLPQGPYTPVPSSAIGTIVSIADKIDTLVGYFAIGITFKGDKDPFGLRRQALGLLRNLIEHKILFDVNELIKLANNAYQKQSIKLDETQFLIVFLFERLRHFYIQKGFDPSIAHAVISKFPTNPYDFNLRMNAVKQFFELPEAKELAELNKRVRNILSKHKLNGNVEKVNSELFKSEEENILFKTLNEKEIELNALFEKRQYTDFLKKLVELKLPIDLFFEKVMVMVEDKELQNNRLSLLYKLENMLSKTADISKLAV